MPLKVLPAPKVSTWGISELAGGLNLQDLEYKIADNQSPDCKNVWFNNRVLCKRWGTAKVNPTSVGGPILAMYDKFFQGKIVFAAGTHLYTMDPNLGTVNSIYDGLTANKGVFFRYSVTNATILWYLNGAQFVQFDGVTVKPIDPYIPTVVKNRTPTGGGNTHTTDPSIEDYNRLGAGFTNLFNGDGSSKVYTLTDNNLDATAVTATVGGVNKVEGTDFTVNRTTGVVTFNTAPAGGVNNNVSITAYKTRSDWYQSIVTCTKEANFGGPNNNRLFFAGNGTSYYYWSDAAKAHYWPLNQYNYINTADDVITGFGLQNDTLLVFKGRSVYGMTYTFDNTTSTASFPVVNVNANIGCDCPGTIQLINNKLTWLTSYLGPMTLVNQLNTSGSTVVYRNVNAIGRNINGNSARAGLLSESNLENAVAVDFGQKYWIAVNGHVYLWDYGISPYVDTQNVDKAQMALSWWYFDNLDIQCFCQDGTNLYFGDSQGFIHHFIASYNDEGAPISAYWRMKINHLGAPNYLKNIMKIWFACRTDVATTMQITYYTDMRPDGIPDHQPIHITSFSWWPWNWAKFSWGVHNWFGMWRKTPPMRNVMAFSVRFDNANANEDLNVSDIIVAFIPIREVRRSV